MFIGVHYTILYIIYIHIIMKLNTLYIYMWATALATTLHLTIG